MTGLLHRAWVQVAAVAVAVGLSGAAPLLEAPHDEPQHRCQCPKGAAHHDCDCPLCAAEAARAAAATGVKTPPCHLERARKAAGAEREAAARRAARGPVLASTCGVGDQRIDPPPVAPIFTVPAAPIIPVHPTVALLDEEQGADAGVPVEPETPPPKLA